MAKQPNPSRTFRSIVKATEEEQRRQRSTSPFYGTGMHPTADGGMDVDGTLTVGGELNVTGDTVIGGTLSLPAGIINNDALANPVVPGQAFLGASTFSLTVAGGNIVTITRTTPAGFTSVVVNAYGRVAAVNSTASLDALYCAVDVNGAGGNQFGQVVDAGSFGSLSAGYSTLVTGLSAGDPVVAHLFASTGGAAWASNVANGADLSVTYLWFR